MLKNTKERRMYMSRLQKVRTKLNELKVEALLVTEPKNLRYLANFTGSAGVALVTADDAYFITDFRYTEQAAEQAKDYTLKIHQKGTFVEVNEIMKEHKIQTLAIEANQMNVTDYLMIKEHFEVKLVETQGLVEEIREIKEEEELELIKAACEITDQAFEYILTFVKPGLTELAVANELEAFLKGKGATAMSFDTIVASGIRSAMPHGVASDKVIEDGDIITLDFGCYYKGYSSDLTRTFAVGSIDPKLKEIYNIVLEAHERVIQGTKAGMTGKEIDALARDYITEKGYGDYFGHSTGHGLGLDVHELPSISTKNDTPVQENMVITNEPGIYVAGLGGVRIENDLVIKADGVESLNRSSKELIIL